MSRWLLASSVSLFMSANAVCAETPQVSVDIAPIHSLVSMVMEGAGEPSLIIPAQASPHTYALRPSEAEILQNADIVFWIGIDLTPWLARAVDTLADDAEIITLIKRDETLLLTLRDEPIFSEEHSAFDDEHDHEHGHEDNDPHIWLSPQNAINWLPLIAQTLSTADPENSPLYWQNAEQKRDELSILINETNEVLDPVRNRPFVVFHDAFQYFENAFELAAGGAIGLSDASDPSPARMAEIQEYVLSQDINCILAEVQFKRGLIDAVVNDGSVSVGVIDPIGTDLEIGPDLYPTLIRNLAANLRNCLNYE